MFPDPRIEIGMAARERRTGAQYHYVNANRERGDLWVLQRTLSGRAFFREGDGSHQYVTEGQAMLFSHSDGSQYGYPPGDTAPYTLEFISMRGGLAAAFGQRLREEFGPVLSLARKGEAGVLFDSIVQRFRLQRFSDTWHAAELAYRLLVAVWREQGDRWRQVDPIDYCRIQIETRYHTTLSIKELAHAIGLSREHLTRAFAERFGESPGGRLRRLRLERAARMLTISARGVEDIGLACGYAGGNSFVRAFKEQFGTSPAAYRRQKQKDGATAVPADAVE